MSPTQIAFLTAVSIVVFSILLIWIPFRSGRSPLAIYDLGSSLAVAGTLSAMSVDVAGAPLWLGGAGGLAVGISAALLVHMLRHRINSISESKLLLFYVLSFVFFGASTAAGTLG